MAGRRRVPREVTHRYNAFPRHDAAGHRATPLPGNATAAALREPTWWLRRVWGTAAATAAATADAAGVWPTWRAACRWLPAAAAHGHGTRGSRPPSWIWAGRRRRPRIWCAPGWRTFIVSRRDGSWTRAVTVRTSRATAAAAATTAAAAAATDPPGSIGSDRRAEWRQRRLISGWPCRKLRSSAGCSSKRLPSAGAATPAATAATTATVCWWRNANDGSWGT